MLLAASLLHIVGLVLCHLKIAAWFYETLYSFGWDFNGEHTNSVMPLIKNGFPEKMYSGSMDIQFCLEPTPNQLGRLLQNFSVIGSSNIEL